MPSLLCVCCRNDLLADINCSVVSSCWTSASRIFRAESIASAPSSTMSHESSSWISWEFVEKLFFAVPAVVPGPPAMLITCSCKRLTPFCISVILLFLSLISFSHSECVVANLFRNSMAMSFLVLTSCETWLHILNLKLTHINFCCSGSLPVDVSAAV